MEADLQRLLSIRFCAYMSALLSLLSISLPVSLLPFAFGSILVWACCKPYFVARSWPCVMHSHPLQQCRSGPGPMFFWAETCKVELFFLTKTILVCMWPKLHRKCNSRTVAFPAMSGGEAKWGGHVGIRWERRGWARPL